MNPLDKARAIQKAKRDAGIKTIVLTPIEKAKRNPTSLRAAINGKCYDCVAGYKNEIRNCQMTDCTLHPVRPYRK